MRFIEDINRRLLKLSTNESGIKEEEEAVTS